MSSKPITTIPGRAEGQPVFDFQIDAGYCRVVMERKSVDANNLVLNAWAYQIDANGNVVLDTITKAPVASIDFDKTIALSGVMAGTHALYDAWCYYMPQAGTTIDAKHLPDGWTSGNGAPTGKPAYGVGYYDTAAQQGWVYTQGNFAQAAQSVADALAAQIDTAAKLAALGL